MKAIHFEKWVLGLLTLETIGEDQLGKITNDMRSCMVKHLALVNKYEPDHENEFVKWFEGLCEFSLDNGFKPSTIIEIVTQLSNFDKNKVNDSPRPTNAVEFAFFLQGYLEIRAAADCKVHKLNERQNTYKIILESLPDTSKFTTWSTKQLV